MAIVGNIYLNFSLWAFSLFPAWLVIKDIGVTQPGMKFKGERDQEE
jgi:hypothetical protein